MRASSCAPYILPPLSLLLLRRRRRRSNRVASSLTTLTPLPSQRRPPTTPLSRSPCLLSLPPRYDLFDAFVRAALQASADASAGGGAEGGADAGTSTSLAEMRSCVERLPAFSCALLWVLFQHIRDVVACEEDNRMSMQNVLITLGINFSRSRRGAPNISPLRLMIEDPSIFEGVPLPLGEERAGEVDEALRLDLVCVAAGDSGSKPWWRAVSEVWMRYAGIAVPDDGGGGGAADEDD